MKKLFIILVLAFIASLSSSAKTFTIGNYQFDLPSTYAVDDESRFPETKELAEIIEQSNYIDLATGDLLLVILTTKDYNYRTITELSTLRNGKVKSGKENGIKYKYCSKSPFVDVEIDMGDNTLYFLYMSLRKKKKTVKPIIGSIKRIGKSTYGKTIDELTEEDFNDVTIFDYRIDVVTRRVSLFARFNRIPKELFDDDILELMPDLFAIGVMRELEKDPKYRDFLSNYKIIDFLLYDMKGQHIATSTIDTAEIKAKQDRKNRTSRYSF